MSYEEIIEERDNDYTCSVKQAHREWRKHCIEGEELTRQWAEFQALHGVRESYPCHLVLEWLGY